MLRPGIRRTAKMLDPGAYPPRQKWVRDVTAYEARPKMLDPGAYPPRQRWVRDVTAYRDTKHDRRCSIPVHTHLVRGGSVMLQPTGIRSTTEDARSRRIPTSSEVGP